jgi:hypothetical protein
MEDMDVRKSFTLTFSDEITQIDDVKAKARCRVFYKGKNRNRTYITDEFANKLISTAPYTPVKGIYDEEKKDYTTHGEERSEGRIYGIVPEDPNFAWEPHLDEDGVEREYACLDVFLFTGIYGEEAEMITKKAQSMELYAPSIEFHTEVFDGETYWVFDDGAFLGLQALGDDVEPCFEGASFFTKNGKVDEIEQLLLASRKKAETLSMNYAKKEEKEVNDKKDLYELERRDLRPKIVEAFLSKLENRKEVEDVYFMAEYQTYVIVDYYGQDKDGENYEEKNYRVKFAIDGEDNVDVTVVEPCTQCWLTEKETEYLTKVEEFEKLKTLVDTYSTQIEEEKEEKEKNARKVEELEGEKATLTMERENFTKEIESLKEEVETLEEFKHGVEKEERNKVFEKFSAHLPKEVISKYRENEENYTTEQLEKELSYEFCLATPSIFSKDKGNGFIPKDGTDTLSGVEAILEKNRRNKKK